MKVTMPYLTMNIGKDTCIPKSSITGILNYESRNTRKVVMEYKEKGKKIVDVTGSKSTESVILTDGDIIYKSPLSPRAVSKRYSSNSY